MAVKIPQDEAAELAVLRTICEPGNEAQAAEVTAFLTKDDFISAPNRHIFTALNECLRRGDEVSPLTIKIAMEEQKTLGLVGGMGGLYDTLTGETVRKPVAVAEYLQKLRKYRDLMKVGSGLIRSAEGQESDPDELAEIAGASLAGIVVGNASKGLCRSNESTSRILQQAEDPSGRAWGVQTGFSRLDGITMGFQPGQLIVLAARPGIGKTAKALNWILYASRFGHAAYFSLEMTREELVRRIASNLASVSGKKIQAGQLNNWQMIQVRKALAEIDSLPILIDDRAEIRVQQIIAQCDRATQKAGESLKMVVIDHLHLMPGGDQKKSESDRLGEITGSLKRFAKDRGVPLVLLAQLNREIEHRPNSKPQLSDLRSSGSIEQDADMVMFLHRKPKSERTADPDEPDRSAELIIAKHRDGELDTIPLEFFGAYSRYVECNRETDQRGNYNERRL